MPFKKGQPPGPGRPEGSKNKNFLVPSMWLELLWNDIQNVDPESRWPKIKWVVEQMMPKVPGIAATPGDSVNNAAIMAAVEAQARSRALPMLAEVPPDAPGLDSTGINGNGST